jgi:putative ABC transport system permease protein
MNILTSLTKKNLILNKRRSIVTVIGIVLSCALICGVALLISSFQQFFINVAIEDNGPYHAIFKETPVNDIKYIEQNAYIKESYKSKNIGFAFLTNRQNVNKPFLSILGYDSNSFKENDIKLLKGRLPKNSSELIISNEIMTDGGVTYKIGDKLSLNIGDRILNNQVLYNSSYPTSDEFGNKETFNYLYINEYTIVGIMEKPKYESSFLPGYQVITYLDNTLLSKVNNVDISVITKKPAKSYEDLAKIAKQLKLNEPDYNDNLLRWYGTTGNVDGNKVLYIVGLTVILIIMIASIIVIHNSFNISVTERKKQFGMLASIGTTTKQLRNMVLKEGLILSVIGIPIGILFSILGIGITLMVINNLNIFNSFYSARLELAINPLLIIVATIFCALTIFLSSLIPAFKTSRISPIDAIRLTHDIKIKGKKLRTSKLARMLFGIEGELGLKNMKRSKKKYRSTIISIFVSIVLFMTVSAFANYAFKSATKLYDDYNFNVVLYPSSDTSDKEINNLYNDALKMNNIKDYSLTRNLYLTTYLNKKDINPKIINSLNCEKDECQIGIVLSTIGEHAFKNYINKNKQDLNSYINTTNQKAIILRDSIYHDYINNKIYEIALSNVKVGNKIGLYHDNKDLIKDIEIGIYSTIFPTGFGSGALPTGSIQGFISNEVFDTFSNDLKMDNYLFINSSNPSKLVKNINVLLKQNKMNITIVNIEEEKKQMDNIILTINIFLYGFITLISLITITNVINTITTSIYLRRTEFAMMKAVGMTNKEFNRMIRFENIYYGLKSLIYGLPVGIFLDYFLYKNINSVFVYDYRFPFSTVITCIISVVIITSITTIYSIKKIQNDNIIDAIKQENI